MKLICLLSLFTLLSFNLYADECGSHFEDGKISFLTANNKFTTASSDWQSAYQMDDTNTSNHPIICAKLASAANLFEDSSTFFSLASVQFSRAEKVCEEERRNIAVALNNQSTELVGSASQMAIQIINNLPEYCN